ncbi:hypothetical protein SAMN05421841_4166 [Chryseobacterium wanjuense]|uniref:Uncharacterized protein n=1 Tax=Chryseobacterium wanjuense TaxID=356305 RepID=A0A1I0S3R0_9FLAO|nr:hypothetical protein [Chryseobacterium wanjuense]SEW49441.1 hypothetical protein SAMN05421841_4166 [Chryseobacterium wanjuense]
MKKLSIVLLTACSMLAFGQKISDYKYISLPAKFETFKEDFGLSELFTKTLRGKNYTVIPADKLQWPAEAKDNPCNVLMGDVKDDSGFLRNKVLVQFKDCNDKVVSSIKGASSIKDFKEGFQDALKQTFVSISPANPVNQPGGTKIQETVATTQVTTQSTVTNTSSSAPDNSALKFSNGKIDLQKIQIDNSQFILVNSNSSSPFATFKATTKSDVFRVKLQNGDSTLGYYENGNIVIEIPQSNGEFAKEVFLKK